MIEKNIKYKQLVRLQILGDDNILIKHNINIMPQGQVLIIVLK